MQEVKKPWQLNLYILWFTQVLSLMSFGLGLPFIPYYIQELGVNDPVQLKLYTAILSGAPAVTMAIMAPIWGILSDKYGRKLMILRAMLAAVFIIGLMGMSTNVWHLIILRAAQGLFTGTITASSTFVAANTPKERLSYALGFLSSSTFIGYSIGPMLGGIIAEWYGYRISFLTGAAIMLFGFFLALFLLKEDSTTYGQSIKKSTVRGIYKEIFTPTILVLLAMLFMSRVIRTVFATYLPLYVQESLGGTEGAAYLTGVINGMTGFATAVAGISISRVGDRLDKRRLMGVLLILGFGVAIPMCMVDIGGFKWLYSLLFFFIGGIEPVLTAMTAEITPADKRGALFGIQGLVGSLGWVVSPIIGAIISTGMDIRTILYLLPILLVANFLLILHPAMKSVIVTRSSDR